MAVLFQYDVPSPFWHGLLPIAFITPATQAGPPPVLVRGWSEYCAEGITQLTDGRAHALISVRTSTGSSARWLRQIKPVHVPFSGRQICSMASGALHRSPAPGV